MSWFTTECILCRFGCGLASWYQRVFLIVFQLELANDEIGMTLVDVHGAPQLVAPACGRAHRHGEDFRTVNDHISFFVSNEIHVVQKIVGLLV